jgi:hypothetical protein
MLGAFLWGALATSSLLLGGLLACAMPLRRRTLGWLMGFGSGTLLAAVFYGGDRWRRQWCWGSSSTGFRNRW